MILNNIMENLAFQTRRLGFRFIKPGDHLYLETLESDPEIKEFFPSGTLDVDEIKTLVDKHVETFIQKKLPSFLVFHIKNEDLAGRAYFDLFEPDGVKVGYLLHKKYWNNGYATEVLKFLLSWAKKHIETEYIIAYADKNNMASFKVMEKCGMKYYRDGIFRGMESKFYRVKLDAI